MAYEAQWEKIKIFHVDHSNDSMHLEKISRGRQTGDSNIISGEELQLYNPVTIICRKRHVIVTGL